MSEQKKPGGLKMPTPEESIILKGWDNDGKEVSLTVGDLKKLKQMLAGLRK